ncbi:flagellar hook-associated protein FlgL [Undibacterium sp. LX40W]|uniref:Flagellar hook-associated protein FlgL n=1 Tax=Undibacterium nitidum TaxID=2762298 RepID=A0A923HJD1_9BURK|nr:MULTISPECIES: flagellar hook-associated protein FlgL [Undibacterium]MBC3880137.1 flagellar hook-associated protein FlgL [Undibacterium nitidum]MBC3891127.1 flagellar hook-associated protein FlgL [Undibacterium sp. LX40W]
MRISTTTIFQNGGGRISDLQVALNRTQQQIAAGRRILSPSDDPIGSARALVISQSDAVNDQYATNRKNAINTLSVAENTLGNVTDVLHNVKTLMVSAGNGVLSDQERSYIANELQGNLDQLLGLANSTDGTEAYLFSGFSSTVAPYTKTQGGASYNGDQGVRSIQVDTSRQIPISESGNAIFGNIRTSTNQFNVVPNPSNTGTATTAVAINVPTTANLTGNNYEVAFDSTGLNFSVKNTTTGNTVVPSTAYTNPTTVTVDGMDITVANGAGPSAAPGPNDKYTVQPGNQNIFETLTDVINALRTSATTSQGKLELNWRLNQANSNVDKSLSNVLTARTNFGTSLKELDELNSAGDSLGLIYKQELSDIQDLDYAKAITELNQNQVVLQAAQQSFVKATSLSLFSYMN